MAELGCLPTTIAQNVTGSTPYLTGLSYNFLYDLIYGALFLLVPCGRDAFGQRAV
jgi:hypothetical protein